MTRLKGGVQLDEVGVVQLVHHLDLIPHHVLRHKQTKGRNKCMLFEQQLHQPGALHHLPNEANHLLGALTQPLHPVQPASLTLHLVAGLLDRPVQIPALGVNPGPAPHAVALFAHPCQVPTHAPDVQGQAVQPGQDGLLHAEQALHLRAQRVHSALHAAQGGIGRGGGRRRRGLAPIRSIKGNELLQSSQIPLFTWTSGAQASCCVTCKSADGDALPLLLPENNFHSRPHRKVAIRHTLPNIQISLSLRTFSMMAKPSSSCPRGGRSWQNASQVAGTRVVDMGPGSGR
ncbi:hypothetical protein EYF80_012919 [Liparis tanakae]|uniref:Uncharacterized protein n=1 Tax=Liparis tanakae TaxID=230148 RepID=A0A4Z2IFW3_9TELE|nr:hypothetical protein EYF80_012919 [Liparis tanakae]